MAYINFYRKGQKYKIVLGEVIAKNPTLKSGGSVYGFNRYSYDSIILKSAGYDICAVIPPEQLDFSNPDTMFGTYPTLQFPNEDGSLILQITRQQKRTENITGRVGTAEIKASYDGYYYLINLTTNPSNPITNASHTINRPNATWSFMTPSASNYPNEGMVTHSHLCAMMIDTNEGKKMAFTFIDPNIKTATSFLFASNDALEGGLTRGYLEGCIFKDGALRYFADSYPYTSFLHFENGKKITPERGKPLIYGSGTKVTSNITTLQWFGEYLYMPDNAFTPDDPDFPKYPDEGGDDPNPGEPTGGDGDQDKTSDEVSDDDVNPSYSITGLMEIHELGASTLQKLGSELWSENVFTNFLKITGNPIDSIIALYVSYINFDVETAEQIYLGNVAIDIIAPKITNIIKDISLGSINISKFWGDFKDFNPYTKIQIYLPYIGLVDLNVNEVMDSTLTLKYRFNILSNTCVALITIDKTIDETHLNSVLYQFDGTFMDEIPVSAANNNSKISARLAQLGAINTAVRQIANPSKYNTTTNKVTSGINAGLNIMQYEIDANHLDVQRTGNMKGGAGILSINIPYLIIERCIPAYPANYEHMLGIPLNRTLPLNTMKGFTQVMDIFIDNFTGTSDEYSELISILQDGVVF